jgi:hypothetical protein
MKQKFFILIAAILFAVAGVQAQYVCQIGSTNYTSLDAAITAVTTGGTSQTTIKLLQNITHTTTCTIDNKKITFDLNGYNLVFNRNNDNALVVQNNSIVDYIGTGNFKVIINTNIDANGLRVRLGSVCKLTYVEANDNNNLSSIVRAINCEGGTITVNGDVKTTKSGSGGSTVGIFASGNVIVNGNVIGSADYAVSAVLEGNVIVNGNVSNTYSNGIGAHVLQNGRITTITVNGTITAPTYIQLTHPANTTDKTITDYTLPTTKPGYFTYTDGTGTVWVKIFPVTNITNLTTTSVTGIPLTLSGTVAPSNATFQNIVWSLGSAGTTGAIIIGNTLHTATPGIAGIIATIENGTAIGTNYVQVFYITVNTPVCQIGTTNYGTLEAALNAVQDGQTIKLLADILYDVTGITGGLYIADKNITFDLNGKTLDVVNTSGGAVVVQGSNTSLNLLNPANGAFNATGAGGGIAAQNGATATVTNATGAQIGVSAVSNSNLVVKGNVTITGTPGYGAMAMFGSTITIDGVITVPAGAAHIMVGSTPKNQTDITLPTTKAGYLTYTDGTSTVWVKDPNTIIPVTDITGAPATATAGTVLTLTGTVVPGNASNQTIVWSVQNAGTTGATISGNTLNTTTAGTVTVRASITNGTAQGTNYTKDFSITVNAAFVPVTNITSVPATATAGTPLTLTGTVVPGNATNQTIVWSVQNAGTTGATITGNTLNTTAAGTVTVRASITNGTAAGTHYTQDFDIEVSNFVGITETTAAEAAQIIGYYNLVGQRLPQAPEKGVYIIMYDNGKVEKRVK